MPYKRKSSYASRPVKRRRSTMAAKTIQRAVRKVMRRRRVIRRARPTIETKLLACNAINGLATNGTPISQTGHGGNLWAWSGILQSVPSGWDSNMNNLGGIACAQGTGVNQHVGAYVYYKKTHLTFQIDMEFTATSRPPLQFRCIVAKARQKNTPSGSTLYPQNTLFLDSGGAPTGALVTGDLAMNTFEVMNQPLNKRDWIIRKDFRFTLSHPMNSDASGGQVGYSGKYPNRKNFMLDLGHYKKTRLSSGAGEPQDLDAHYFVYIFATAIGSTVYPSEWNVYMRGTTSYTDA